MDGKATYSATVGCNGIGGDVTVTGDRIAFSPGIGTLMACGSPLDEMERRPAAMLGRAKRWRTFANTLEFKDEAGSRVALFEAVPR